ncbi:YaiO family outer membrane beta-barrel protein [Jiulongibacter sediminis]|jgi:YaiO family outer membrane protein|uniref:YaiO family outer membrane beta-barrel protein n=1 Tax=Jiulongibacter sediminis TaxID=1605367 RepID=UPI0026EC2ADB|nr:YaiO family outer membrane beta-barrel protein [Jiulongibacter sediminis]
MKKILTFFLILIISGKVTSQELNMDPDEAFSIAREMAFDSKRQESKELLTRITNNYPTYGDVRLFLAVLYGWEEQYKLARKEFQILLDQEPQEKEYWVSYIKNEMWAEQYTNVKELSRKALEIFPDDPDFVIFKAKAERDNREVTRAIQTCKKFLSRYPENEKMQEFYSSLREGFVLNQISASYSIDHFSDIYDPMHYYTVSYNRDTPFGSIIGKMNVNQKFETTGTQFEIDSYPSIADGLYAYVNVGYSQSSIFPGWRYGFQLYKSLPKSFEASAGIRSLKFGDSFTHILTGSLGKYVGNSFFFFTPYLIPSDEGWSKSGNITFRNYGENEDIFWAITAGAGFSPEINRFGINAETLPIINLKSQKLGIANNFKIKSVNHVVGLSLSVSRQESIFDPGQYFFISSAGVSYSFGF